MPSGRLFGSHASAAMSAHRHGPVGAGDREDAVGEIDIGLGGFEQMRGDRLGLVDDLLGRQHAPPSRPSVAEREPPVPSPIATLSVSPWM